MPRATLDDLARAHRVLCYGAAGCGKSTAAERIGRVLHLPVHLVDDEIGWLPGWQQRGAAEQLALGRTLAEQEQWVLDSAWSAFRAPVLARAQVVVALDYPRLLSLARLTRRTLARTARGTLVCNGNVETWRDLAHRDSVLLQHARSFTRLRARMRAWEAAADEPPVLRLSHPRELADALDVVSGARIEHGPAPAVSAAPAPDDRAAQVDARG